MGIPEAGRSKTPELQKILGFFVSLGAKRHFSKEAEREREREREREGERERTAAFRGTRCRFACSSSERPPPVRAFLGVSCTLPKLKALPTNDRRIDRRYRRIYTLGQLVQRSGSGAAERTAESGCRNG